RGVAIEVRVVAAEVVLLLVFAGLWLALGDPGGDRFWRVVLLVVAASAMGIQAALSLALKIPNVLTVALTATVANLGQRLGLRAGEDDPDPDRPPTALLATLVATYAVCALVVAALRDSAWIALLPPALLSAGVALDLRRTAARPARIAPG
ncbi:MAG TPA: DUF1275 family protein, partial [Baekduia sp.]|nr:DUF1275 family protein [Baekduia sp.]